MIVDILLPSSLVNESLLACSVKIYMSPVLARRNLVYPEDKLARSAVSRADLLDKGIVLSLPLNPVLIVGKGRQALESLLFLILHPYMWRNMVVHRRNIDRQPVVRFASWLRFVLVRRKGPLRLARGSRLLQLDNRRWGMHLLLDIPLKYRAAQRQASVATVPRRSRRRSRWEQARRRNRSARCRAGRRSL